MRNGKEPHPLPLTRQWVEDYKRWGNKPKPEAPDTVAAVGSFERWLADHPMPDLQELIDLAGWRHAASIGEEYVEDPVKRPSHQGGYQHIAGKEWTDYNRAMADWQRQRQER
jgi:hypothetical protein